MENVENIIQNIPRLRKYFGGYFGDESQQKLIVVDADNEPDVDHEISEPAIFCFLLNEELREKFDEAGAEIPEMLDVLKDIDKQSKITEFETHQSSMGSVKTLFCAFHVFIVFKSTREKDGVYWWSLEKNQDYIVLQRSRNKDNVKDKCRGDPRNKVKSIKEDLKGKGTIKDLFALLWAQQVIAEKYHVKKSNCQSFVTFISKRITEEEYEYKGYFKYSPPPENVRDKKMLEFLINLLDSGVNEWHPLFYLILFGDTDLVDKFIKSGEYDINAFYKGLTPLHLAIMLSKNKMVQHLLNDPINADPTRRDKSGMDALHWAGKYAMKAEIFDLLLLAHPKVNVDDVDENGRTALCWAASTSNVIAVQKLLGKGADPNITDKTGRSPLCVAAWERDGNKIMDLLLAHDKVRVNDVDKNGDTALHLASAVSNVDTARKLLDKGANPNLLDQHGQSPLHVAAQQRDGNPIIDVLLEAKKVKGMGDVNDRNEQGMTALHWAAFASNEITFELLIQKDADPNRLANNGSTPLHMAAFCAKDMKIIDVLLHNINEGNIEQYRKDKQLFFAATSNVHGLRGEIVDQFFKKGIITTCRIDGPFEEKFADPSTDLIRFYGCRIARAKNSQEIDEILKENQFDINGRDQNGITPLLMAVLANNVNGVRLLLERGADPTIGSNDGFTPFQMTVMTDEHCDIIKLLLESGKVDINETIYRYFGLTALQMAIRESNSARVEFLLSRGANPNFADKSGYTPLHAATEYAKDMRIVESLLNHPDVDVNCLDNEGQNSLHYAKKNQHGLGKRIANRLREKGAVETKLLTIQNAFKKIQSRIFNNKKPEEFVKFFSDDDTIPIETKIDRISEELLLSAIKDSNFEIVRNLLKSGAAIRTSGGNGGNLLHFTSFHAKTTDVIDVILETGKFDINGVDNDGRTPLHHALQGINPTVNTAHLLQKGADPTIGEQTGNTLFHLAAVILTDSDVLGLMLGNENKIDIDHRNPSGMTALHMAINQSNTATVEFLLSKGANPNSADENGLTPLHLVAKNEETTELIDIILETGQCNINPVDSDGRTPLHYAINRPKPITINARRLIKMGANSSIADKNGVTPLHMVARNAETMDLIELLLNTEKLNVEDYDHNGLTPLAYARANKHGLGQRIIARLRESGAKE